MFIGTTAIRMIICTLLTQCKAFSDIKKVMLYQVVRQGHTTRVLSIIVQHTRSMRLWTKEPNPPPKKSPCLASPKTLI